MKGLGNIVREYKGLFKFYGDEFKDKLVWLFFVSFFCCMGLGIK